LRRGLGNAGTVATHTCKRAAQPVWIGWHENQIHIVRNQAPRPHLDRETIISERDKARIGHIVKAPRAATATLGDVVWMTGDATRAKWRMRPRAGYSVRRKFNGLSPDYLDTGIIPVTFSPMPLAGSIWCRTRGHRAAAVRETLRAFPISWDSITKYALKHKSCTGKERHGGQGCDHPFMVPVQNSTKRR
jgi:hypothetical protein